MPIHIVEDTHKSLRNVGKSSWETTIEPYHAHFDCFSGAAGDMLLASCLDACEGESVQKDLLDHVIFCLENGLPDLKKEFGISMKRVWKGGMGSIAGMQIVVDSTYNHEPAPVPTASKNAEIHSHHRHIYSDDSEIQTHSHHHNHSDDSERNSSESEKFTHSHDHHSASGLKPSDSQVDQHSHSHSHQHSGSDEPPSIPSTESEKSSYLSNHSHSHISGSKLRNLPDIVRMLNESLDEYIHPWVRINAVDTFTELAKAEAQTHGVTIERVHFHEVGAVDSIVDTVGTLIALHALGVKSVSCSRLPLGEGSVWTDHGCLPVPAPATLRLLINMPICKGPPGITGELVTPTAAALLRVLAQYHTKPSQSNMSSRPPDNFVIRKVGVGAGTKEFYSHPNILRLFLGNCQK